MKVKLTSLEDQEEYVVGMGSRANGQVKCGLFSKQDSSLTMQIMNSAEIEAIQSQSTVFFEQEFHNYDLLIDAILAGLAQLKLPCSGCQDLIGDKIILRSLLQIAAQLPWANALAQKKLHKEKTLKVFKELYRLVKTCPSDRNPAVYEDQLVQEWELYIGKLQNSLQEIRIPKPKYQDDDEDDDEDEEEEEDDEEEDEEEDKDLETKN